MIRKVFKQKKMLKNEGENCVPVIVGPNREITDNRFWVHHLFPVGVVRRKELFR